MPDQLINPVTLAFELLDQYRGFLRAQLISQGVSPADVDTIMDSVDVDRGLHLSINRKYQLGATSFAQFCSDQGLAPMLPDALGWFDGRHLYAHQEMAITAISKGSDTVVATGTGSGKTEAFLIPILDYCLKHQKAGLKAIVVYPMNALANDQIQRMEKAAKWLSENAGGLSVTIARFTGEVPESEREAIRRQPPDILITNYVMLDWMLTRSKDERLFNSAAAHLRFIVLDEIHTYRGNRATHMRFLLARLKAHLQQRPIHIGTSATLQGNRHYQGAVDQFIHPLFDAQSYAFVRPQYVPEPVPDVEKQGLPVPVSGCALGWSMIPDTNSALQGLGDLLGKAYLDLDLKPESGLPQPYADLRHNPFVQAARAQLVDGGAQSFVDFVTLMKPLIGPDHAHHAPEDIVRAYFSALAYADFQWQDLPSLLDYRLHLFLREIDGALKRCPKCGRYHAGGQDLCQDCGVPLFHVYCGDIRWCIGKVSGQRLRRELDPATDDAPTIFYVLLASTTLDEPGVLEDEDGVLRFDEALGAEGGEILLSYNPEGALLLKFLPAARPEDVTPHLISLVEAGKRHPYLRSLIQILFDALPERKRKLLGFIDDRELASQYAAVLQDEFASRYLEAYMRRVAPAGRRMSPVDVWQLLHRNLPDPDEVSDAESAVFRELDLWYWRLVGSPPRLSDAREDLLQLRDPETFSELERAVLQVFIAERALLKPPIEELEDAGHIRFAHYAALDHRGIHVEEGGSSADPRYPSISLGPQAREYREAVKTHGDQAIKITIDRLVKRDVLHASPTPDGKMHVYLDPEYLVLNVGDGEWTGDEVESVPLMTARAHSSEVKTGDREAVEADFKAGDLNCVIATPTLEMGIDIGDLDHVLMIGAPPLPSNYVQRAGRAGRGQNQHALIVTFCRADKEHDVYYFDHPKELIDGAIAPPRFNPTNAEIVKKHVNAYVMAGHVDRRADLDQFRANLAGEIRDRQADVSRVFGANTVAVSYLERDFAAEVHRICAAGESYPQAALYRLGYFPDYAFRRDMVYLVDRGRYDMEVPESRLGEIALAEREPEQAYRRFAPGETGFVGNGVYTVSPDGIFKTMFLADGTIARSYRYMYVDRETRHANKDKTLIGYDRTITFDPYPDFVDHGKVLSVAYMPACEITFVNRGRLGYEETEEFGDTKGAFALAYRLERPALLLRFAPLICEDARLIVSLASSLDRAMKDRFRLDESEVKVLLTARPAEAEVGTGGALGTYVVFYEADGNGNVSLDEISRHFDDLVAAAHETMSHCQGLPGQPCEIGCYQCTRSYALRHVTGNVDKQTALMFTGYLLGKNRFRPGVRPPERAVGSPDLLLKLKQHGSVWQVTGHKGIYEAETGRSQNETIFNLLADAAQSEYEPGMQAVEIQTNTYVQDVINQGHIKKDKESFAHLMFTLMRFQQVAAGKEL